jgi:hypothetical protein
MPNNKGDPACGLAVIKHFNHNAGAYRLVLRKTFIAAPAVSVVRTLAASACMNKRSVRCSLTPSRPKLFADAGELLDIPLNPSASLILRVGRRMRSQWEVEPIPFEIVCAMHPGFVSKCARIKLRYGQHHVVRAVLAPLARVLEFACVVFLHRDLPVSIPVRPWLIHVFGTATP